LTTADRNARQLVADTSLFGLRVTRELDDIIRGRYTPTTIVSDHGTEFNSNAISAGRTRPVLAGVTPGKQ
jgi:putative transposase